MKQGVPMKKTWLVLLAVLFLFGCRNKTVEVQNEDDGRLRIDEQHTIDFYHDLLAEEGNPIVEQCLQLIGNREPDEVSSMESEDHLPGDCLRIYTVNGAKIMLWEYGIEPNRYTSLWAIDLGPNHVLSSGIRVGSTEDELKRCYEGYDFHLIDNGVRMYALYGPWYERYPILFEIDDTSDRITRIDYELDI